MMKKPSLITVVTLLLLPLASRAEIFLGPFLRRQHLLAGDVYLLTDRILEVRNFNYDGLGPDAFFWADTSASPSSNGLILQDGTPSSSCGADPLPAGDGTQTYQVEFPEGTSIMDYLGGSISVWCRAFRANFGEVIVPQALDMTQLDGAVSLQCSSDANVASFTEISLGSLANRAHQLAGEVVALSDRALEIRGFNYDGLGPDAFFWADTSAIPTSNGIILQDGSPLGSCGTQVLPAADGTQTYRVEFPQGTSLRDFQGGSIGVWCRAVSANFGEVVVPSTLNGLADAADGPALECSDAASPANTDPELFLGAFVSRAHDLQGEVYALSDRVLEVRGFEYDGLGPDAFFWADTSASPTTSGKILYDGSPSSSCGAVKLPAADGTQTFRVEFPAGSTLRDYVGGSISVWCIQAQANFGEIIVPANVDELATTNDADLECKVPDIAITPDGYNCEPLHDIFQVRWQVQNNDMLAVELVGVVDEDVYMSFGVSGNETETNMIGANPVVADMFGGVARARDFYMNARAQCSNGDGVCTDDNVDKGFTDDVSDVSGEQESGITVVRYKVPLSPTDVNAEVGGQSVDRTVVTTPGVSTFIVWALGPVDTESGLPFFHTIGYPGFQGSPRNPTLEFGRTIQDNCSPLRPPPEPTAEVEPFERPVIRGQTELVAHIGPSGGDRGYAGITGRTGWGIAWYINDLLIPVIEMVRGTTYTFVVNGGDDPSSSSEYHPFYLTDSIDGGYVQRTPEERAQETIYAGLAVESDGSFEPLVVGPLCSYQNGPDTASIMEDGSYNEFFESLDTSCAQDSSITDNAAILTFTPDENTKDLIYYQCVTHRNLGWEIRVVDSVEGVEVDCSAFESNTVQVRDNLALDAIINTVDNTLKVKLTYDGLGWLAMAFTPGTISMVGAEAVIGLPDDTENPVAKYNLNARVQSGVQLMPEAQQTLTDVSIEQTDTQTILSFTKILEEPGEHPISSTEENVFLFAFGSGNELSQHAGNARGGFSLRPNQCRLTRDGEVLNPDLSSGTSNLGDAPGISDNQSLWKAHGWCAATAWAILVPLAVGSSLIRHVLEAVGLPKGAWFQIHRALNAVAAILTVVAFSLAVRALNLQPGETKHFSTLTHHKMGLAIFIMTLVQAGWGMFRPHLPKAAAPATPEDAENGEGGVKEPVQEKKSKLRLVWECKHRLFGAALLGMAWWQIQDGIDLYYQRFEGDGLKTVFWAVVLSIVGVVTALLLFQTLAVKKKMKK